MTTADTDLQVRLDAHNTEAAAETAGAVAELRMLAGRIDGPVGVLLSSIATAWADGEAHRVSESEAWRWSPVCDAALAAARATNEPIQETT